MTTEFIYNYMEIEKRWLGSPEAEAAGIAELPEEVPEDLLENYGEDCLRAYIGFVGLPGRKPSGLWQDWDEDALEGVYRFLGRVYRSGSEVLKAARETAGAIDKSCESAAVQDELIARMREEMKSLEEQGKAHNEVAYLMKMSKQISRQGAAFLEAYLELLKKYAPLLCLELNMDF